VEPLISTSVVDLLHYYTSSLCPNCPNGEEAEGKETLLLYYYKLYVLLSNTKIGTRNRHSKNRPFFFRSLSSSAVVVVDSMDSDPTEPTADTDTY
jgi:hypothetical protein